MVEWAIPFDVELRVAADESGRVYFSVEGPPGVLDNLAFEFDAQAEDGFTVVSEMGLIGGQGPFPPGRWRPYSARC